MYRYILFDLDGTLTDPKEGITKSAVIVIEVLNGNYRNLQTGSKLDISGMPYEEFSILKSAIEKSGVRNISLVEYHSGPCWEDPDEVDAQREGTTHYVNWDKK